MRRPARHGGEAAADFAGGPAAAKRKVDAAMTAIMPPLDDGHAPRRPRRWMVAACIIVLAALLPLSGSGGYVERGMDPVTGTMRWHTVGPLGIDLGTRVDTSPLEKALVARGIAWTPGCRWFGATGRNLLGGDTYRACGTPPPIYELHFALADFVAVAGDDEVRSFVRAMDGADDRGQRAVVEQAIDRLFPCTATVGLP